MIKQINITTARPGLHSATWLVFACVMGGLIATQSPITSAIVFALLAYGVFTAITPLSALMFLLILAPLRTLIATESAFQLPLDIGQLAFIGLLAGWVFNSIIHTRKLPQINGSPVLIPIFIILGVIGLSAFNAISLGAWITEWLKWLQILLIALFALSALQKRLWEWAIVGLVTAGSANALIGIYQFFGGSGADHLLINGRFFRAFGTFGQPNPLAGFLGLIAPLALMAALAYGLRCWRNLTLNNGLKALFYTLSSAIMLAGIGVSWSRGAWLGIAAAIAVMVFALPRKFSHSIMMTLTLFTAILLLWSANLIPASIIARISSSTEEFFGFQDVRGVDIDPNNYAVVERLAHWQAALNMSRENPWLGVGMGNYEVAYPDHRLINWKEPLGHAHNYYLNILAEAGLIGFLGYGKAWILIIGFSWRVRQHPDTLSRLIGIGLLASWTYLLIHSIFDNLFVNNVFLHIGLMLGILAILYNQVNQNLKSRMI